MAWLAGPAISGLSRRSIGPWTEPSIVGSARGDGNSFPPAHLKALSRSNLTGGFALPLRKRSQCKTQVLHGIFEADVPNHASQELLIVRKFAVLHVAAQEIT